MQTELGVWYIFKNGLKAPFVFWIDARVMVSWKFQNLFYGGTSASNQIISICINRVNAIFVDKKLKNK